MKSIKIFIALLFSFSFLCCSNNDLSSKNDGYRLWLGYHPIEDTSLLKAYQGLFSRFSVAGSSKTCQIIRDELNEGLTTCLGNIRLLPENQITESDIIVGTSDRLPFIKRLMDSLGLKLPENEGFMIHWVPVQGKKRLIITSRTEFGLLYGAFQFLRCIQTGKSPEKIERTSAPRIQYRLLNHWDNMNRSVERGYAGKSLWKWDELPDADPRYRDYARANASLGINGTVLNNVNANPNFLRPENLKKIAKLADIFRPYGLRVFLSINFSSPISADFQIEGNRRGGIGDLSTSDPLDPDVRQWWKEKAAEIYELIPDFGGFLVKANSEGMPGPQEYHRTHAEGANMLAEALAPYHGIVMWRAFVYNAETDADRANRAYKEFVPLDGQFEPNVFVQSKNGPVDFQPREPVAPLFGAMPKTPMMLELQITQEYLGHSTHLVYLAPMWKEYLTFDTYAKGKGSTLASVIDGSLHGYAMTGIAGVTNIGDNRNWTGHFFAQANWYAYGRLAWDHTLSAETIADEWISQSLTQNDSVAQIIHTMMMGTWEACINYMTPLGLHHIMQAGYHYGPQPSFARAPREDWTSVYYHRADSLGIGFNRSTSGSNAVSQYYSPWKEIFNSPETCPEKYLLWFHHLPWDYQMKSGGTLWEALCTHYYTGTGYVDEMAATWKRLNGHMDPSVHAHVTERLKKQQKDSKIWRDTCLHYFQKFSRRDIVKP